MRYIDVAQHSRLLTQLVSLPLSMPPPLSAGMPKIVCNSTRENPWLLQQTLLVCLMLHVTATALAAAPSHTSCISVAPHDDCSRWRAGCGHYRAGYPLAVLVHTL